MNRRFSILDSPFRVWLLLTVAFASGVLVDRAGWLPGPNRPPRDVGPTFYEAWHLVERDYVDRQAVQPERMTRGAIQGMLASLGDVGHTTYLTPEEVQEMKQSLKGYFEGIGAHLTVRKGQPTVAEVIPDSPAQKAGLHAGDVLKAVNGKDVSHLSLERIVQLVRGPAGTTVDLQVLRKGDPSPVELHITRGQVRQYDVSWHLLPGTDVAHLAIHSFLGQQVDEQLKKALAEADAKGAKGLILDVRGNPGGLKDQAVRVTSEFLKGGIVFIEQDARGHRNPQPVLPGGTATDVPVVVLIDEGTASSAEIFAGALQDHQRGPLIGTKTFGTGTVLERFPLSDGSEILLAVYEWLTPDGRQIWHKGITPDVEVTLPERAAILLPDEEGGLDAKALADSDDKQLLKALQVLQEQMNKK